MVKAENESLPRVVFDRLFKIVWVIHVMHCKYWNKYYPYHRRSVEVAKRTAEQQSQVIELCRALINNYGWKR